MTFISLWLAVKNEAKDKYFHTNQAKRRIMGEFYDNYITEVAQNK